MIEIDYNKSNELKFTLDVTGHVGAVDEVRFVLNKDNKKVIYTGKLEDGIVTVKLDSLNEIFDAGEHKYCLEVIIGNQYFKPLEDKINLKKGVKVSSNIMETKAEDAPKAVQVTKIETNKETIELKEKIEPEESRPKKTKLSAFLVSDITLDEQKD